MSTNTMASLADEIQKLLEKGGDFPGLTNVGGFSVKNVISPQARGSIVPNEGVFQNGGDTLDHGPSKG